MEDGLNAQRVARFGGNQRRIARSNQPKANPVLVKKAPVQNGKMAEMTAVFSQNKEHLQNSAGKKSRIADGTLYVASDIGDQSNTVNMLTVNTKKLVGITNFDGNKLDTGRNVVIRGIRGLFTTVGGAINTEPKVQTADWMTNDAMPAELLNGEVVISQGDKVVLSIPVSDIQGQKFEDFRDIFQRPMLVHGKPISIAINLPLDTKVPANEAQTATAAAIVSYFRLELRVAEATTIL